MKKCAKILAAAVLAVGCLFLSGCQDITKAFQAENRDYGESYVAQQPDSLTNAFFEYTVKSAQVVDALPDGSTAEDEGDKILIVEVEIHNVFGDEIPMSNMDFELKYQGMTEEYGGYPLESGYVNGQLQDEWNMAADDTETGTLLFIVPSGVTEFGLEYVELWDDDFEGNTYTVEFTAEDATGTYA